MKAKKDAKVKIETHLHRLDCECGNCITKLFKQGRKWWKIRIEKACTGPRLVDLTKRVSP